MVKFSRLLNEVLKEEEMLVHGSPERFECFRPEKITTTAYGWGIYLATETMKSISMGYTGGGGQKQFLINGETPNMIALKMDMGELLHMPPDIKSKEEILDWVNEEIEWHEETLEIPNISNERKIVASEKLKEFKRIQEYINKSEVGFEQKGYLYRVLAHGGKKPSEYNYLDLDKYPTPEQVTKINNQIKKENLELTPTDTKERGSSLYDRIHNYFIKKLEAKTSSNDPSWLEAQKQASLFLLRAGIDGNTHSNGSIRIIFSEKALKIIDRCNVN